MHHLEEEVASHSLTVSGPLHHVRSVLVGKKYSSCVEEDGGARVGEARYYLTAVEKESFRSWSCKAPPLSVQIVSLLSFMLPGDRMYMGPKWLDAMAKSLRNQMEMPSLL
jgi:hypothetical protein